jgi:hypothetical protein
MDMPVRPRGSASARAIPVPAPSPTAAPRVTASPIQSSSPGAQISPVRPPPPEETPPPAPHRDEEDSPDACPAGMALIHGDSCLVALQDCTEWLDTEIPVEQRKRCAKFAPSRCQNDRRQHVRYCIDRLEHTDRPGGLPTGDISWTASRDACLAEGKRLCTEAEWTFACEGPEMLPYPYGYQRDAKRCNHDRLDLVEKGKMLDHRKPVTDYPDCKSPFGVMNMIGNIDEWVVIEKGYPPQRSGLKGGWWLAGRNRCRPMTAGHDEYFHEVQTGYRCCKDAASKP